MSAPEMWECKECGACWSESKAKICLGCSSNDIFIYWKPGQVKFDADDYTVKPEMLTARTPAKAADEKEEKPDNVSHKKVITPEKPVIAPNKRSSRLRDVRRSPVSRPKSKSKRRRDANAPLEVSKLREDLKPFTGKLTDLF